MTTPLPTNPTHPEHVPTRARRIPSTDIMSQGTRLSSIPASRGTVVRACCEPDISQQLQPGAAFLVDHPHPHHDHERLPLMLHHDSIDLLVTAAVAALSHDDELATDHEQLVISADTLGQILTDASTATPDATSYQWQPVAELLTPTLVDELILQLERTRLAYIEHCQQISTTTGTGDWSHSPARRYIDRLGTSIRERLNRDTTDPYRMILTSSELEHTDADWRRPTIHAHHNLTNPQEDNHGQP